MKLTKLDTRNITNDTTPARAASTTTSLRVRSNVQAGAGVYESGNYAS
jgi:hypothetical protein